MLKQNLRHVKSLPPGSQTRRMAVSNQTATRLPRMLVRLKSVLLIASLALTTALVLAQASDFEAIRRKAEAGDSKAQFDLAAAYSQGTGVAKDGAKGLEWLRKSAMQGYPGAQVVLGVFYQRGIQVAQDPSEAAKWYQKAARQSAIDPKHAQTAQSHLSEMLAQGLISAQEADWNAPEPSNPATRQTKANRPLPFSLTEVETGLTGGITTKRMATLLSTYGVDFVLSANARRRLIDHGADDALLAAIASAKR
jgi:hypothetical protein